MFSMLRLYLNLNLKPMMLCVLLCFAVLASNAKAQDLGITKTFLSDDWQALFPDTDFKKTEIDLDRLTPSQHLDEILPSIDKPLFTSASDTSGIGAHEPIIVVKSGNQVRGYPVRYLLWFHAVNDTINGKPILVTFSPYTDSFAVFSRRIDGKTYDFSYTGLLYQASLLLKDKQTGSFFLQVHGRGAVGALHEKALSFLPSEYLSLKKFIATHGEDAQIMQEPDIEPYDWVLIGKTPLAGYENTVTSRYYQGTEVPVSNRISHFNRLISYGGRNQAWSVSYIRKRGEVRINSEKVRIRWESGLNATAEEFTLKDARDIGMIHVEKEDAQGRWKPILFHRDFMFAYYRFFPNKRILHD